MIRINGTNDESFSVYIGCTHAGIPAFHLKLYYEPLHTIEKYTLIQYTIFQLKIISDLYFRMLNMNIVNYQIYKK